jgi:hypothetical protein
MKDKIQNKMNKRENLRKDREMDLENVFIIMVNIMKDKDMATVDINAIMMNNKIMIKIYH